MIFRLLAALVLLYAFIGCTSMKTVNTNSSDTYLEISALSQKRNACIELMDGTIHIASAINFENDTIRWEETQEPQILMHKSIDKVRRIIFVKRGKGAWQGYLGGFLVGMPIGVISGFASGDDPDGFLGFTAEEKAVMYGLGIGGIVGVAGAIVGIIKGNRTIYNINQVKDIDP